MDRLADGKKYQLGMNIADPPHELRLISNPVLRVSLSDFEVPLKTGRLKANYASCLSRRRKLEAAVRNPSRGKAHSCNHEHRGSPPLFNDKFISSESSIFLPPQSKRNGEKRSSSNGSKWRSGAASSQGVAVGQEGIGARDPSVAGSTTDGDSPLPQPDSRAATTAEGEHGGTGRRAR